MTSMSVEKKARLDREINYSISCNVGNLYVLASHMGYDLKSFSDLFLTSHFCERSFDTEYSRFQNEEEDVSMEYLLREISPNKTKTDAIIDDNIAFWIGFIYRFLYFQTGTPSSKLKEKVPFDYLERKAYGLLTLDEEEAVGIICSDCKLK